MRNTVLLHRVPILILFLIPTVTYGQVEISEIMYDLEGSDAGREWIEVVNTGNSSVDITNWKLFEADTNHKLNLIKGESNIAAGGYAVIADNAEAFSSDFPNFSGVLYDSSFSLKNTGEFLALRNPELVDINSVTYSSEWGASGDGNSLQLVSGKWVASSPTPGGANTENTAVPPSQNESNEENQEVQTTSISSSFPVEPKITAYAEGNKMVIVGAGTEFIGEALGLKGEPLAGARYQWNMGNGELREGKAILHSYQYPGEYVVTLTVSSGQYTASDRLIVTATEAQVSISKASTDFIELTNGSNVELNLSWWMLKASKESFTIPKDTLILAGKTLVFSNEVTKLAVGKPHNVALLYPNGAEAYYYSDTNVNGQTSIGVEKTVLVSTQTVDITEERETFAANNAENFAAETLAEEEILLENGQALDSEQIASPLSGAERAGENGDSSIYKWLLALVSIISIASIGVLLGRRRVDEEEIKILD